MTERFGLRRNRRWLLATPLVGGLLFLGWAFRPLADSPDLTAPRAPHGLLVDVRVDGALVLDAQGRLGSWSADGHRRWVTTDGTDRVLLACTAGCAAVFASADGDSFSRPEVADPAPLLVDGSGSRALSSPGPRERVLWARDAQRYVVSSAKQLGLELSVISVAPRDRRVLASDSRGDALLLSLGDEGMLLTHDAQRGALVVPLVADSGGWRVRGAPVEVAEWSGGCFGVVDGRPVAVVYGSGEAATLVAEGKSRAVPGSEGAGVCAISEAGPVIGTLADGSTVVRQFGADLTPRWQLALDGNAEVSADASSDRVALSVPAAGKVTIVGPDGKVMERLAAVSARVVGGTLVTLPPSGGPTWQPLP